MAKEEIRIACRSEIRSNQRASCYRVKSPQYLYYTILVLTILTGLRNGSILGKLSKSQQTLKTNKVGDDGDDFYNETALFHSKSPIYPSTYLPN